MGTLIARVDQRQETRFADVERAADDGRRYRRTGRELLNIER